MSTLSRRSLLRGTAGLTAAWYWSRVAAASPAAGVEAQARQLVRRAVVIDANLVPPLDDEKPLGAADAEAVRASGLTAVKASLGGSGASYQQTREDIAGFVKAIAVNSTLYMQVRNADDLAVAKRSGRVGIIFSFESVEMLEGRLERIDEFAQLGVRVMQLSYNRSSLFASGVMAPAPASGLTALGRQAIARFNTLGVTLDLSHSDEKSSLEALHESKAPPLITHAGCASVHAHPRNKSDALLRALADRGGTVGIYQLAFLSSGPAQPTLDDYFAHMTHALKVCGEEHVGMGSDALLTPFDTSPASVAEWQKDIAARKASGVAAPGEGPLPFVVGLNRADRAEVIAGGLLARGYPARVAEKVMGENFRRVFAATWK